MGNPLSDLDIAWEQVVAARGHDDTSAEARALSLLERALYEVGRGEEAPEIGRQVIERARRCPDGHEILLSRFETWMRYGARLEEGAGRDSFYLLELAHDAYCQALAALDALDDAPEPLKEEARTRAEAARRRQPAFSMPAPEVAETVVAGFLAVKVLGPFLEEWARKLGEQFGESTVRVLGRIRVRLASLMRGEEASADKAKELEVFVPGAFTSTVLVIPRYLSDSAKLAVIDLDLKAVRGQTLYWHEGDGMWLKEQEWLKKQEQEWLKRQGGKPRKLPPAPKYVAVGCAVRYTWAAAQPGASHPRHTYTHAESPERALERAERESREAANGGLTLSAVHIRRPGEEGWSLLPLSSEGT